MNKLIFYRKFLSLERFEVEVEVEAENSNEIVERVEQLFEPGRIHLEEYRAFWREDLNSSAWVMETLEQGYKLPFHTMPGAYEERNNASARADPAEVRKIVGWC